jgi:hypothetical protein
MYNLPSLNSTLKLTPELFGAIIADPTLSAWNDPRLVALNPGLSKIPAAPRMVYNTVTNNINQLIINFMFPGQNLTSYNGDFSALFSDLGSFAGVTANGWEGVVNGLSSSNVFTIVPLPTALDNTNNGKYGIIVLNTTANGTPLEELYEASVFDELKTVVSYNDDQSEMLIKADGSIPQWPLNVFGYAAYHSNFSGCDDLIQELRFGYWSFNNTILLSINGEGFSFVDADSKSQFLRLQCQGKTVLKYDNLSIGGRSVAVLVVSIILMVIYAIMLSLRIKNHVRRTSVQASAHFFVMLLGLALLFVSFIVWYFPPSHTWYCVVRMWFFGLGMTCIVSSFFLYGFVVYLLNAMDTKDLNKRYNLSFIFTYSY